MSPEGHSAHREIDTGRALIRLYGDAGGAPLVYALIPARYGGKWVWGRKAGQDGWEFPGGHIEPGETPREAAARELAEESGAAEFSLRPLGFYSVSLRDAAGTLAAPVYGVLFCADIARLGPLRHEIAEIKLFDCIPDKLSYPDIQPHLMAYVLARFAEEGNAGRDAG